MKPSIFLTVPGYGIIQAVDVGRRRRGGNQWHYRSLLNSRSGTTVIISVPVSHSQAA